MHQPAPGTCPICSSARTLAFRHVVLNKYPCEYYFCDGCGLLQTQEPHWLDEAYGSAIGRLDTGILARNIKAANVLSVLLPWLSRRNGRYLDIAGGYGVLTRLMRDRGFDYHWSDKYCENLFARGFEGRDDIGYDAVSAFEVLEHVADPVAFLAEALATSGSRTIVLSTELFAGPPPAPADWWYYAFEGGQHVSFYQRRTLHALAGRLGLNCFPGRSIHVLSDRRLPALAISLLTSRQGAALLSPFTRIVYKAKTMSDHLELSSR